MMKKNGFTLAEVLITLTIIGVVAMMTLPALLTNVAEQQAKTGLKKGINSLTEAAQMSQAISGFDYGSLRADITTALDSSSQDTQTMTGLLLSRLSVDIGKSNWGGQESAASRVMLDEHTGSAAVRAMRNPRIVFLRDGSAIVYRPGDTLSDAAGTGNSQECNDGLPLGFTVIYDINGEKGPNMLSNCDGVADATADNGVSVGTIDLRTMNDGFDTDVCTTNKAMRSIKDQFLLQVRRSTVTPVGRAATWTATN